MNERDETFEGDDDAADKPTRVAQRAESSAYAELAGQLTKGKFPHLPDPPFDETLKNAVRDARRFSKSAKPRQIRRLAGLLRKTASVAELHAALQGQTPALLAQREFDRVNLEWRTRLVAEGDVALAQLCAQYPDAERPRLRQLARNAMRSPEDTKSKRAAKSLLREIRELRAESQQGADDEFDQSGQRPVDASADELKPD